VNPAYSIAKIAKKTGIAAQGIAIIGSRLTLEVPPLQRILTAPFFAILAFFLDRHSLGDVCCGYSCFVASRPHFFHPPFFRLFVPFCGFA
jgi:hypothetical protein